MNDLLVQKVALAIAKVHVETRDEFALARAAIEAMIDYLRRAEVTTEPDNFLDVELETIDFGARSTPRLRAAFRYHQIHDGEQWVKKPLLTVRDLVALHDYELRREPNVGEVSIDRVKAVLAAHGLKLKTR